MWCFVKIDWAVEPGALSLEPRLTQSWSRDLSDCISRQILLVCWIDTWIGTNIWIFNIGHDGRRWYIEDYLIELRDFGLRFRNPVTTTNCAPSSIVSWRLWQYIQISPVNRTTLRYCCQWYALEVCSGYSSRSRISSPLVRTAAPTRASRSYNLPLHHLTFRKRLSSTYTDTHSFTLPIRSTSYPHHLQINPRASERLSPPTENSMQANWVFIIQCFAVVIQQYFTLHLW